LRQGVITLHQLAGIEPGPSLEQGPEREPELPLFEVLASRVPWRRARPWGPAAAASRAKQHAATPASKCRPGTAGHDIGKADRGSSHKLGALRLATLGAF